MAYWRHLANTIEPVLPLAHRSPQPKRHLDWFSRFCTDDRKVPAIRYNGTPLPLKTAPFHGGCGLPSNTWFPSAHPTSLLYPKRHLDWFSRFTGLTNVTDRPTDRPLLLLHTV